MSMYAASFDLNGLPNVYRVEGGNNNQSSGGLKYNRY